MLRLMSLRDLRNTPNKLWRALRRDKAVALAVNGVPRALVVDVEGGDIEALVALVRQIRAKDALVRLRFEAALQGTDKMSDEEINAEILATRAGSRRARSA
jgi:hypothetical protein